MTKPFLLVASVIVLVAAAAPTVAGAQASRRGGGESSGGSSSSGSTAGARSAPSGGDGTVAVPRASAPTATEPSTTSASRTSTSSQPAAASGTTRAAGRGLVAGASYAVTSPSTNGPQTPAEQANLRLRGSQAIRGVAQPRPTPPHGSTIYRSYGSSTWFSPGYGVSYGYYSYNPWRYGYSGWGLYGSWYDPYLYDPFGYYGVYRPYGYSAFTPYYWTEPMMFTDEDSQPARHETPTGSLRLKVNPRFAKVYVDGALAGVADEFDGLGGHLEIEAGPHRLEFRADGYAPYTGQVNVKQGRTSTERVTLKKQ